MDYIVWATLAYLILDKIHQSRRLTKIQEALILVGETIDKNNQSQEDYYDRPE